MRPIKDNIDMLNTILPDVISALGEKKVYVSSIECGEIASRIDSIKAGTNNGPTSKRYTGGSVTGYTWSQLVEVLKDILADIRDALINKAVDTSTSLKMSEVADEIRKIPMYGEPYADAPDYFWGPFEEKGIEHVVFTDEKAPDPDNVRDWSKHHDQGVVQWLDESTNTLYVSTQRKGLKVILTDCDHMFTDFWPSSTSSVHTLKTVDFANVDASNVWGTDNMFYDCTNLTSVDFTNFKPKELVISRLMFYGCKSLETLDLRTFNTSKLEYADSMFGRCDNLETLHLETWDVSSMKDMGAMFQRCPKLKYIYAQQWAGVLKYTEAYEDQDIFVGDISLPNYVDPDTYPPTYPEVNVGLCRWSINGGCFTKPEES